MITLRATALPALLVALGVTACTRRPAQELAADDDTTSAIAEWTDARLSATEIDSTRYEASWRMAPSVDSLIMADSMARRPLLVDSSAAAEKWEDIDRPPPGPASAPRIRIPVGGQQSGPSVLYVQVLLARSPFHPGVIDGKWGKNSEKAVFWLQHQEGLPPTGQIDSATFRRLDELAGHPASHLATVTLTAEDVAGPFAPVPEDVYEKAKADCLCYESLAEKLAERYQVTEEVLARLNQGIPLAELKAGDSLTVPAVTPDDGTGPASGSIARLIISDQGHYLHAVDSSGRILHHFPTTLGSTFYPSPAGELTVTRITRNPWFHWQPKLLEGVPDTKKPARLPPGPNSPVGVVWIALSEPHFGIHGTNDPATIGYTTSSGCIRLTNWDARFLAGRIAKGLPVVFRDVGPRVAAAPGVRAPGRSAGL